MKWSEFKKLAKSHGWQIQRHGAQHDVYFHPDRQDKLIIERHWSQEIRPGLYKKLMRQIEGE